jgi:hypothetical protein
METSRKKRDYSLTGPEGKFVGVRTWGTWWILPVFTLYGVLYATPGDSRWHDFVHGVSLSDTMSMEPHAPSI